MTAQCCHAASRKTRREITGEPKGKIDNVDLVEGGGTAPEVVSETAVVEDDALVTGRNKRELAGNAKGRLENLEPDADENAHSEGRVSGTAIAVAIMGVSCVVFILVLIARRNKAERTRVHPDNAQGVTRASVV